MDSELKKELSSLWRMLFNIWIILFGCIGITLWSIHGEISDIRESVQNIEKAVKEPGIKEKNNE